MSILENISNVGETPSPNSSMRPRSRLRSSSNPSTRYRDQMQEEEEESEGKQHDDDGNDDGDDDDDGTDTSSPQQRRRTPPRSRNNRSRRGSSKSARRLDTREESVEEEDDQEEEEEEVDDQEGGDHDDRGHGSNYSFRQRGSMKKPARFDESLYDEVFRPLDDFSVEQTSKKAKKGRNTGRRSRNTTDDDDDGEDEEEVKATRRGSRRASRKRGQAKRRRMEHEEQDEDEVEVDEMDYATDESDLGEIQRRIEEQERAEAAEAAAALAAVEALEQAPPRHTRSTRYALRHKDEESSGNNGSLSPVRSHKQATRAGSRRSRQQDHTEEELEDEVEEQVEEEGGNEEDGDGDEGEEDEEDEEEEEEEGGQEGGRYHLRRRSNSDLQDHSQPVARSSRSRTSARAAPQRSNSNISNTRRREHDRDRDRRRDRRERGERDAVATTTTLTFNHAEEDNGRRYSLRDRAKVQRSGEALPSSKEVNVYAEYAKRQASRGSNRNGSGPLLPQSRSSRSNRKRRSGHRSRRLSGSSSSSGSSDENFKYYDSDQGGMRAGGGSHAKRKGGSGGHSSDSRKRADITPIEVDRGITWDSVGGLEKHIEALKEMVMLPLLYPEFYEKYNVTPPSGVLFYGPPGTGKTLLARALANSCTVEDDSPATTISIDASEVLDEKKPRHVNFYMRKGADCLSKWVGEAERQLRLLFEEAKRNQPAIIFFDEIDGLAPVRSAKQDQIHASIVSTLLALMDGLDNRGRVVVIGATNRLDAIDPALRRPGRFDRELGFKLPNVQERKKMLEIHTKKWNPPLCETFVQEVAQRTVGYCGADVKALCAEAALCALKRVYPQVYGSQDKLLIQLDKIVVSRGDFTKAMKKITPASHRTVSSFASPLPRGVKVLLDTTLRTILTKISHQFPLFPLDPQALDALYKSDGSGGDGRPTNSISSRGGDQDDEDDENEDADIYAVMNHDDCDVCHGDDGELLCCDACPGAFHALCLPPTHQQPEGRHQLASNPDDWFCPECSESTKMDALLEAKHAKQRQRQARQMYMLPQLVGFPRVLITGVSGMGQQYVGAALLHAMEGLSHFTLDYPSLVADVNTHNAEEALIYRLNEAQKCLPCVIYLPQADLWWENTTQAMHIALKMMLMNMQVKSNLPVLFLATTSNAATLNDLPESLLELFTQDRTVTRSSIVWQLTQVSKQDRYRHFDQAFAAIGAAPLVQQNKRNRQNSDKLEVLPFAPVPKKAKREPTMEELERIRERDFHCLRELRIFLGQVLDYCAGNRLYAPFHFPVDAKDVPDYYLIIKHPMDLATIREKLNDGDYTCFEQFVDDIQWIVRNATLFNPKRSATRHIAHAAGTMKDNILSFAHRFRKHQGYDLFAKCREITKRLHTNPALYSQIPDSTTTAVTTRTTKTLPSPARASARLQGIKAPETETIDAWTPVKSRSNKEKSQEHRQTPSEVMAAPQWFGGTHQEVDETMLGASATKATDSGNENEEGGDEDDEDDEEEVEEIVIDEDMTDGADVDGSEPLLTPPVVVAVEPKWFQKGDTVFVKSRTYPGINKEGGAGKILQRNEDGTYYVKYVLGGSEKNVEALYINYFTDDAVKESVKNQRPDHHDASSHASSGVRGAMEPASKQKQDKEKTKCEMEMDFFGNLVWPILEEQGWSRTTPDDIESAFEFVSPASGSAGAVVYTCVKDVLEYIESDKPLSTLCFGKRYAEESATDAVFGTDTSPPATENEDDNTVVASVAVEQPSQQPPVTQDAAADNEKDEDEELEEAPEPPKEFVYDETRMKKSLTELVDKTAGWTVEELRDELLLLNKLAYPFRYEYDRTKLMQDVEDHVTNLRR